MPLFIENKRVNNYIAYAEHKKMKSELIQLQRFVRGGHPEYKEEIKKLKKNIAVNKILA